MSNTTKPLTFRSAARQLAASRGISLDRAQVILAAASRAVVAQRDAAASQEPLARRVAEERGISIEQARSATARILADVDPSAPPERSKELVVSSRAAARALASARGLSLDVAQRLLEAKIPRRRPTT